MIRVHQVKCTDPKDIEGALLKKLKMSKQDLLSWSVHRKSVDARKQKVLFSFIIDAEVRHPQKYLSNPDVRIAPDEKFTYTPKGNVPLSNRPVVVGFGPGGMFAALLLAQMGYCPLVLERGSEIDKRTEDVHRFWQEGILDPQSNVQYGMGGAGAFSDGKLTTRSKDLKARKVFEELVRFGASPEILYQQHPHIGTDGFVKIVKALKQEIEHLGGQFLFDSQFDDMRVKDNRIVALHIQDHGWIDCQALIIAMGHSASDTIRMLNEKGLAMESKPFAIGVRIEHDQTYINQAMLKDRANDPTLIPARYQVTQTVSTNKGVYSFCMCPGGYVVAASSEPNTVVVNGMSYSDRSAENANAALLVQVDQSDTGPGLFAGLDYQEQLEHAAYDLTHSYRAPMQKAKDFVQGVMTTRFDGIQPTYPLGHVFIDFNTFLPPVIAKSLKEALLAFEQKIPGFIDDAILTGVETRSSSSIRVLRDKTSLQATVQGVYPCGEGAGYSGGITTSAIDGLRCAMALMDHFDKPSLQSVE